MKYSIITINYNNKDGLQQTINSVLSQTCQDFEFIIIDGGSTDGSVDVIRKYEGRISYWVSERDNGRYHAMNKGVRQAHGEYLNFMNSGDAFHSPTVLDELTQLNCTEDFITGGFYDREKNVTHIIYPQEITLLFLLKETFNHQATFYRRELFRHREYDEKYVIVSDAKFNLQSIILDNCSVRIIKNIIADYDFNGVSSNKARVIEETKRMHEELFPKRILIDYQAMYTPAEIPLITLFGELKLSPLILKISYQFTRFLLKCKKLLR